MEIGHRIKQHRLSEKKTFFHVLMVSLTMMIGYLLIAEMAIPFLVTLPLMFFMEWDSIEVILLGISCIGGIAVLLFFYWWFSPEYMYKPRNAVLSFKCALPVLFYWFVLYGVLQTIAAGQITFGFSAVDCVSVLSMITAGVCEEVVFREIGISYMKRQFTDDWMNVPIVLITSFVFGIVHLYNAVVFGDLEVYSFQALCAFLIGIFLGCILIRTGNVWCCIVVHAVHDLLSLFFDTDIIVEYPAYIEIWMIAGEALLALCGLFLIRKKKHPEIKELWDEKWQITEFD